LAADQLLHHEQLGVAGEHFGTLLRVRTGGCATQARHAAGLVHLLHLGV
jgi:hypothetical protein